MMPKKTYKKIKTIVLYFVIKKNLEIRLSKTGPNVRLNPESSLKLRVFMIRDAAPPPSRGLRPLDLL